MVSLCCRADCRPPLSKALRATLGQGGRHDTAGRAKALGKSGKATKTQFRRSNDWLGLNSSVALTLIMTYTALFRVALPFFSFRVTIITKIYYLCPSKQFQGRAHDHSCRLSAFLPLARFIRKMVLPASLAVCREECVS